MVVDVVDSAITIIIADSDLYEAIVKLLPGDAADVGASAKLLFDQFM